MGESEPPLLSAAPFQRAASVSRANGWSIAGFAGICALVSLAQLDWTGAAWSVLAAACGAWELRGQARLRRGDTGGFRAMIGSQFALIAVIWAYAFLRWRNFSPDAFWNELPGLARSSLDAQFQAAGIDPTFDRPYFLKLLNLLLCLCLGLVTLIYQGGLAIYYAARERQGKGG